MKKDLCEFAKNAAVISMVMVTAFVLSQFLVGCAVRKPCATVTHKHPAPKVKDWKPSKRCKTLGKAMTTHVAVLVERNCLKNGVTTVNIVVLNKEKKGTVAARHATQAITSILGFKPVLKILFYGKAKGKPFFLTAVTGIGSTTVAKR